MSSGFICITRDIESNMEIIARSYNGDDHVYEITIFAAYPYSIFQNSLLS